MATHAHLDKLPEGMEFPECCRSKIRFDAEHRRLVFQGHMTLYEYQTLVAAHPDANYARAIEWLFRNCDQPPRSGRSHMVWASVAVVLVVVASLFVLFGR